jgi:hypothetical protein
MIEISVLEEDMKIWEEYKDAHSYRTSLSSLAKYLRLEQQRSELGHLYSKLKITPWRSDSISNEEAQLFHDKLHSWRDELTMEILKNGSV